MLSSNTTPGESSSNQATTLGLTRTSNSGFCQSLITRQRCNQSRLNPSSNSISNDQTILARISRISAYARFLPRQLRGPKLNGWNAARLSLTYLSSPSLVHFR